MQASRRQQLVVALAFAAALLLLFLLAGRAMRHARGLRQTVDEPIQPWMTVPYVAHSYHIPPNVLFDALHLQPKAGRATLQRIAVQQGRSFTAVKADVEQAIRTARPTRPRPTGQPLPTTQPGGALLPEFGS